MVFLFYGPNTYAGQRKLRDMESAYVKKTGSNLGLERLEGDRLDANQLASALESTPFLSTSRLVIVKRLSGNKALVDKVPGMVKRVPESTVAVFYEPEVDKRTVYFKELSAAAKTVKFEPLSQAQLGQWMRAEVARLGGQIDAASIALLLEIVGDDQWRLEQELLKLVNFGLQITPESVKQLVVRSHQQTIFDLVEAMSAGRLKPALSTFRALIQEQIAEIYVLTMIIWQLRNLLLAKTGSNLNPPELSKATGMSPYVAAKMIQRRGQFKEETLRRAFLAAVETDYQIKTGVAKPGYLVERLIYRIASQAAA